MAFIFYKKGHEKAKVDKASQEKFPCNVCGKTFASVQTMKNHLSDKHNGEKGAERKRLCESCNSHLPSKNFARHRDRCEKNHKAS